MALLPHHASAGEGHHTALRHVILSPARELLLSQALRLDGDGVQHPLARDMAGDAVHDDVQQERGLLRTERLP